MTRKNTAAMTVIVFSGLIGAVQPALADQHGRESPDLVDTRDFLDSEAQARNNSIDDVSIKKMRRAAEDIGQARSANQVSAAVRRGIDEAYGGDAEQFYNELKIMTSALPKETIDIVSRAISEPKFAAIVGARVERAIEAGPGSGEWKKMVEFFALDQIDLMQMQGGDAISSAKKKTFTTTTTATVTTTATTGPTVITVTTISTTVTAS